MKNKLFFMYFALLSFAFVFQSCNVSTQVSTPVMNFKTGIYSTDIDVTISSATTDATIYYTTDGTIPTKDSTIYSSSIAVAGNGTTMTIKALAVKKDLLDSNVASESYIINYGGSNSPRVTTTTPTKNGGNVAIDSVIIATFNKAMNPSTINTTTFTLQNGTTAVTGTVTYSGTKATFIPASDLSPSSTYIASISTGAKDTSGKALAGDYAWVFTTAKSYSAWVDTGIIYEAPSGSAYYPSVIYNADGFGSETPVYSMWYADGDGSIYLVQSSNGMLWGSPTTMSGLVNAYHPQVLYNADCFGVSPCVDGTTTKYKIWFWEGNLTYDISDLETAESADGINWTNQQSITQNATAKLVYDDGISWNRGTYGPVSLFYQTGVSNTGTEPWDYSYVMYYDGTDGSHEVTGLAYSTDGLYWNAYTGNPVLSGSSTGAWDCYSSVYGTIYKDADSGFHYFYSGKGLSVSGACQTSANDSFDGIGYASSTDGITWTKSTANPVFYIDDGMTYRDERIYTPSVIDDGTGVLKMYYSAKGSSTGGVKKIGLAVLY